MTRLSDFKKLQCLGRGTYGAVYKVIRRSTKSTYALKQVNMSKLSHREKCVQCCRAYATKLPSSRLRLVSHRVRFPPFPPRLLLQRGHAERGAPSCLDDARQHR